MSAITTPGSPDAFRKGAGREIIEKLVKAGAARRRRVTNGDEENDDQQTRQTRG